MQSSWRVYLVCGLVACVVSIATSIATVRLLGPVQRPTHETTSPSNEITPATDRETALLVVEGIAEMPTASSREAPFELEVYYKTPFADPPYLTFPGGLDSSCRVIQQKANFFKLRRTAVNGITVLTVPWKAEGRPAK